LSVLFVDIMNPKSPKGIKRSVIIHIEENTAKVENDVFDIMAHGGEDKGS